jgi:signal transduction histidine kinase
MRSLNNNNRQFDDIIIANKPSANDDINVNVNSIIVTVEDTGTGINKKIKDQLFEKFATRSAQGTGIGLYLSKKIVEAHGGKIWYEEQNDDIKSNAYNDDFNDNNNNNNRNQKLGSIFRFSLPSFIHDDEECV